ncbi:MAG: hypothetical protein HCA25_22600 [Dolichospermum sp. DET50]|nr:hypothetical protein [Dolichospermum sp. DET66]MBS3034961.1 hypothetical protein [Dolichospermum sp. DET67]MBS3040161.1 hypothetical protein [Dolichospermum sp. DET50]QSX67336.1 MAG: hypothetical protein EZY12_21875 [Dolichospermum sp. DET69]
MSLNKSQKTRSCLIRWVSATTLFTAVILSSVFANKAEANHCGFLDFTGNCIHESSGSEIGGPYYSNPLKSAGIDLGYDNLPKEFIDANGDGVKDYCRFIGDSPNIFIACVLGSRNGRWSSANQFSFRSISGVDQGYDSLPRGFRLVNGKAAYCRFVGNAPNLFEACNLTTSSGFSSEQFGYQTGRTARSAIRH